MKKMTVVLMLCGTAALLGCGDADPQPQDEAVDQGTPLDFPSALSDRHFHDGSNFPKWVPQCPGPACDPELNRSDWVVDPPNYRSQPSTKGLEDPGRRKTPAKHTTESRH